jgi:hypothetical protein
MDAASDTQKLNTHDNVSHDSTKNVADLGNQTPNPPQEPLKDPTPPVPSAHPEGAIETLPMPSPEVESSPEIQETPKPAPQIPKPTGYKEENTKEAPPPEPVVENVVNRTDEVTTLHPIKKPTNKLTEEADKEEEEFIEKVEAAHDTK